MVFNHLIGVRFPVGPPNFIMKLLRIGKLNQEKPAIIDNDGAIRNLSSVIKDFDPTTLNQETIKKIHKQDIKKNRKFRNLIKKSFNEHKKNSSITSI